MQKLRLNNAVLALLLCIALAMPCAAAASGIYTGEVTYNTSTPVYAGADAQIERVDVLVGDEIAAGDTIALYRTQKVFAERDGVIASINAQVGDSVDGDVIKQNHISPYTVRCTLDGGYKTAKNGIVHIGQTVYIKCMSDGSHRAVAKITSISGENYELEITGGELYNGEAVYIYSNDDFKRKDCIGKGTVIPHDVTDYAINGCITNIAVTQGEYVERGQLLIEYLPQSDGSGTVIDTQITADCDGILNDLTIQSGTTVHAGERIASIVPRDGMAIKIEVAEADLSDFGIGDNVQLVLPWDEIEDAFSGAVTEISAVADQSGMYAVLIKPDETDKLRLGMHITVSN